MRAALVGEASLALWHLAVQREACGLREMRYVLRDYGVPPEVAARMGALPVPHGPAALAQRQAVDGDFSRDRSSPAAPKSMCFTTRARASGAETR